MAWDTNGGKKAEEAGALAMEATDKINALIPAVDTVIIANAASTMAHLALAKADESVVVAGAADKKSDGAIVAASTAKTTAETIRGEFDRVVAEAGSSNPEVVNARGNFVNLKQRLDDTTSQLADIAYNAKKYSVKGDGVTDDTPTLQALVDLVHSNGGGEIFLPKGIYTLDDTVYWKSGVSLFGAGVGNAILKPRRDVSARPLQGNFNQKMHSAIGFDHYSYDYINRIPMENCHFRDFEVDGNGIINITEYQVGVKGIYIQFMRNCSFKNLYIHDTIATGLGVDFLDKTVIDNVIVKNCGRGYGTLTGVWEGGSGIGIGTGGLESENLVITNCQVEESGQFGIFVEHQNLFDPILAPYAAEGVVITNCIAKNGRYNGIGVRGGKGITVSNNQTYGNALSGILVEKVDVEGLVVSGNIIRENNEGITIKQGTRLCRFTTINNNIITDNQNEGINVISGVLRELIMDNNVIFNNSANGTGKAGISFSTSVIRGSISNNLVKDTRGTKSQIAGLEIKSGNTLDNIRVMGNDFTGNLTAETLGVTDSTLIKANTDFRKIETDVSALLTRINELEFRGSVAYDSFDRANSNTSLGVSDSGHTWINAAQVAGILNNRAYNVSGSGANSESHVNSGIANAKVSALFTYDTYSGISGRYTNPQNHIVARISPTGLGLFKFVSGTATSLGEYAFVPTTSAQYTIRLEMNGSDLKVYLDNKLRISATDGFNSTVTNHGIKMGFNTKVDTFNVQGI